MINKFCVGLHVSCDGNLGLTSRSHVTQEILVPLEMSTSTSYRLAMQTERVSPSVGLIFLAIFDLSSIDGRISETVLDKSIVTIDH